LPDATIRTFVVGGMAVDSGRSAMFRRALAVHPHLESARENLRAALSELVKWN